MFDYKSSQAYRDLDSTQTTQNSDFREHSISPTIKTPTYKQNGGLLHRPISQSKHSLNVSKPSLNMSRWSLYGKGYGIQKSLASLGLASILSTVMGVLSIQLLLNLTSKSASEKNMTNTLLRQTETYNNLLEVTVALSSFVIMLNFCCVLVCSMQAFFTAKILKVPHGEERAFKYLKECGATRFISICGFFISIPVYLVAILLLTVMEFQATSAIISLTIIAIGIIFCVIAIVHNIYFWRVEKNRADRSMPVYENKGFQKDSPNDLSTRSELSTLV